MSSGSESKRSSIPPGANGQNISTRPARLIDHLSIGDVAARAFYNDVLFGHIIHPYRHAFPTHMSRYWVKRNLVAHFDPSHRILVATARTPTSSGNDREVVIGAIHWSRISLSAADDAAAGWGHQWWDPRRLLHWLVTAAVWVACRTFWRNHAADSSKESIIEASETSGCVDHVWDSAKHRCPSWYIDSLAVDPNWQGKGVGKLLVEEGLRLAEREGISASVISADGKEDFYQKCGFVTGPVGRSGMGSPEKNPLWGVPGGMVFFREAPACKQEPDLELKEVEECVRWMRKDIDAGWRSSWLETGGGSNIGR